MIKVSELAKQKIDEVAEAQGRKGDGLRVLVRNGGTPAVAFGLNFVADDQVLDTDTVVEIGDLKVYFADGTTTVLWKDRSTILEPGDHVIGSFVQSRKILRFDVRTQGLGGFYSKQRIIGVRRRQ